MSRGARTTALILALLGGAAATAAAGDADDLTFGDDAADATPGDPPDGAADPDGAPDGGDADLDAPTELAPTPPPARLQFGLGGGLVGLPGEHGGELVNAEALLAIRRATRDDRLVPMLVAGSLDDRSLVGMYLRLESVFHLGDRYSIGFGGMVGVVALGANDDMDAETAVTVGPMVAPVIIRLGAARQHELSVWAGIQRNLANDYLSPAGSLSFDSYF